MTTNEDRAKRWIERAMGLGERDLTPNGTVYYVGDTVYSFGEHFPMAIVMRERPRTLGTWSDRRSATYSPTVGAPRWMLLNGDRYSVTTSRHQGMIRDVIRFANVKLGLDLDTMIVPFRALEGAQIDRASIEMLEVRADRAETILHKIGCEPKDINGVEAPDIRYVRGNRGSTRVAICDRETGTWSWKEERHRLGDSLFIAHSHGRRRRFLSSFDDQEARTLYFLCELPRTSKATTVEQAYEDLKPPSVKIAEQAGLEVTRQGDIFAIPVVEGMNTREVKLLTPHGRGRIVKHPNGGLIGTNHTASEVLFGTSGRVYARGLLYHDPDGGRESDHARRKMGDGRTWHLLVKNTVPKAPTPQPERMDFQYERTSNDRSSH